MTATTTYQPLSKGELRLLRTTTKVSFARNENFSCMTTTHKRVNLVNPADDEVRTQIDVESVVRSTRTHLDENRPESLAKARCHELIWVDCGEVGTQWRTITAFLKPGDMLKLHWGRDYDTNGNMDEHKLHGDRLSLHITRGEKKFCFVISSGCQYDNSARMIKV